jgi:hypothetical protein
MPQINFNILNQLQSPAFYASSLASRPSFGFLGRIFIDTDVPSTGIYRDTGSSWVLIGASGNVTGSGISSQISFWNATNNLSGSTNLTFNNVTGQTFIGPSVSTSGLLVINSPIADNHIRILGANAPSLRISNGGSSPTKESGLGLATTTNDFILGSANGDFCIINSSITSSPILFGVNNGSVTAEKFRISNTFANFLTNVGINNNNPQGKFHITDNVSTQLLSIIENNNPSTSGGTRLSFQYNGTETAAIYNRFNGLNFNTDIISLDYIRFLTAGVERINISATGPVSITNRLNVYGAADNSLFSLNNGGGTLYTNGFSPNASSYTGAKTLGGGTTYVNQTAGVVTWTLPTPSGNNQMYFIKNAGTGILTLNAFAALQIIDLTNTAVSSVSIAVGQTLIIQQDGNNKSYIIK